MGVPETLCEPHVSGSGRSLADTMMPSLVMVSARPSGVRAPQRARTTVGIFGTALLGFAAWAAVRPAGPEFSAMAALLTVILGFAVVIRSRQGRGGGVIGAVREVLSAAIIVAPALLL